MADIKAVGIEESIRQSVEVLKKAMDEAETDEERLAYGLRMAVEPVWSHWIKESGAKPSQIAKAIMELSASLMAETIQNVAKPGQMAVLATQMGRIVAEKTLFYATEGEKIAEVSPFHRRDS